MEVSDKKSYVVSMTRVFSFYARVEAESEQEAEAKALEVEAQASSSDYIPLMGSLEVDDVWEDVE